MFVFCCQQVLACEENILDFIDLVHYLDSKNKLYPFVEKNMICPTLMDAMFSDEGYPVA